MFYKSFFFLFEAKQGPTRGFEAGQGCNSSYKVLLEVFFMIWKMEKGFWRMWNDIGWDSSSS